MCGKYNVATEEENIMMREILAEIHRRRTSVPTGDILPGGTAPILRREGTHIVADTMRWGVKMQSSLVINARSETALSKPLFQKGAKHRRLLLPASGFYEWKRNASARKGTRFFCHAEDMSLLWMAGIGLSTGEGERFVVLTREADQQIAPLHDRMPLCIDRQMQEAWLFGGEDGWQEALSAQPPRLSLTAQEPEQMALF